MEVSGSSLAAVSFGARRGAGGIEPGSSLRSKDLGCFWSDAYHRRDYRGALEIALKINMPGYFFTHSALAAVYGQLGEIARARAALRELHALVPDFGAMARAEYGKWFDVEVTAHLLDGLRKAGLDVPALADADD